MYKSILYESKNKPDPAEKKALVDFLFEHLDQYGDPKEHILKAINYAVKEVESFGGFVLQLSHEDQIIGAVVINRTGMDGYIPGNILVYIVVHHDYRGKGLGKELLKEALQHTNGGVALHVEPDNPARILYEKFGFTNKYLEMRFQPQKELWPTLH